MNSVIVEEGGGVRSVPGEARTILLLYIISARPSKQPLMVRTFLNVYMELGSYFVSARTNKRHHHHRRTPDTSPTVSLTRRVPHLQMGGGCSATGTAADSGKVTPLLTIHCRLGALNARSSLVERAVRGRGTRH